jgi:hypothetical protein
MRTPRLTAWLSVPPPTPPSQRRYNHVTNIINAFTQRYGTPPRQSLVRPRRRRRKRA